MAKVSHRDINPAERRKMMKEISGLLLSIKKEHDMVQLLYRLFTPSEIIMLGRRMQIGELMINGWSHQAIKEELHVGLETITSVERWLEYVIRDYDIIRKAEKKRMRTKRMRSETRRDLSGSVGPLGGLRRRYPLHFLLVNLILDGTKKK